MKPRRRFYVEPSIDQRTPKRTCTLTGKIMFDKRGAVTAKNSRWREDHIQLREYPCGFCTAWHLTSQV